MKNRSIHVEEQRDDANNEKQLTLNFSVLTKDVPRFNVFVQTTQCAGRQHPKRVVDLSSFRSWLCYIMVVCENFHCLMMSNSRLNGGNIYCQFGCFLTLTMKI